MSEIIHIQPALVLGCNTPHGINILSDYIEEQTGHPLDFHQSGWSDGIYSNTKDGSNGFGYGYGTNLGGGSGSSYFHGSGHYCNRFFNDGFGDGHGYGHGEGRGYGFGWTIQ